MLIFYQSHMINIIYTNIQKTDFVYSIIFQFKVYTFKYKPLLL